ncbi:hypothetical protein ACFL27_05750 [candidate division CSSED10-310 bacterium]|uniref:Alkyl hydroperoxide reductase subunit C/ Thiol specific antioxidant domain-containing protein n=1 Tax=candidate division CSSED10-310 bacterium TaxID=2855610 RepID=A0ABV6YU18_UNCC1
MSKVELNTLAPDFSLPDFLGNEVSLANLVTQKNVILIFNRGFL